MPGVHDWLMQGQGRPPRLTWSIATDAPLAGLRLARETGEILAADDTGALYLIDRQGQLAKTTRGKSPVRGLAWSDTGAGGAVLVGDSRLYWLGRDLQFSETTTLPFKSLALAMDPFGEYAAVAMADGANLLLRAGGKLLRRFDTLQPLVSLEFALAQPELVGVAQYGLFCAHAFDGSPLWQEKLFAQVGDLALAGDGRRSLLACFALGIQVHDHTGTQQGSYQVPGTASRVAMSFDGDSIAAASLERDLFWLSADGRLEWQAQLPDDAYRLICDPLGQGLIVGMAGGRILRLDWK